MPVMDTNSAGSLAARSHQVDRLLDSEKTGVALLFSGVFLGLVGVAFTTLGWQQYNSSTRFDWTQFLGPILISVGVTFMLSSVCRFGVVSCIAQDGEAHVMPPAEQAPSRHAFTLNHQIMLHNAIVCIPPPYNLVRPDVGQGNEFPHRAPVNELPPQHDTVCADNVAFRASEEGTEANSRINRSQKSQEEPGASQTESSYAAPEGPPAYEDIYPPLTNTNFCRLQFSVGLSNHVTTQRVCLCLSIRVVRREHTVNPHAQTYSTMYISLLCLGL